MPRPKRTVFDIEGHAFFVTFSCYHSIPLLSRDRCKGIVLGQLEVLSRRHEVGVVAYVIMPDHVHLILRPLTAGKLSVFLQQWKRLTSFQISEFLGLHKPDCKLPFVSRVRDTSGQIHIWQKRYYPYNLFTERKLFQKIEYIHNNPVRAGLVDDPCRWQWSSARDLLLGKRGPVTLVPYDAPLKFEVLFGRRKPAARLDVAARPR